MKDFVRRHFWVGQLFSLFVALLPIEIYILFNGWSKFNTGDGGGLWLPLLTIAWIFFLTILMVIQVNRPDRQDKL